MTAPDPLVTAVVDVLRDHIRVRYVDKTPFCECGTEWSIDTGHGLHVAEVVAAAVREVGLAAPEGLTEETRPCSPECSEGHTYTAPWCYFGRNGVGMVRRCVSRWAVVAEGEQP